MQRFGPVGQYQSRIWMLQLIDALKYMHEKGIAHRDLKMENVLLFDDGQLKIADYGFCKQVGGNIDGNGGLTIYNMLISTKFSSR